MTAEPITSPAGTRIPGFTGGDSLYRSSAQYRTSGSDFSSLTMGAQAVVPAYYPDAPNSTSVAECQGCLNGCLRASAICLAGAAFFPPAIAGCSLALMACQGGCLTPLVSPCCPVPCAFDPFNQPGGGCCDWDEHCVAIDDPNSRHGCCPSNQIVCGDHCCESGANCCGGECCSPPLHCINNVCQYPPLGTYTPPPAIVVPPVSAAGTCPPGHFRCRDQCCEQGMSCCGYGCEWGHCVN